MRRALPFRLPWRLAALPLLLLPLAGFAADRPAVAGHPYIVEWVYRVKYGYKDEWWAIFRKYQVAALDRARQQGDVTGYVVYGPSLHTSEDSRWDYRIEITYPDEAAAERSEEVEKQVVGSGGEAAHKAENRRWELTENHWDLPIHVVDPHAS